MISWLNKEEKERFSINRKLTKLQEERLSLDEQRIKINDRQTSIVKEIECLKLELNTMK